jgi:transposase-like protein
VGSSNGRSPESAALAEERLGALVDQYRKNAPTLSRSMEVAIPEGRTVFSLPNHKHKRLRISHMCKALNTQIKRRTKVAGLFPNTDSILRLVTVILTELSEEWETGKVYLNQTQTKQTKPVTRRKQV